MLTQQISTIVPQVPPAPPTQAGPEGNDGGWDRCPRQPDDGNSVTIARPGAKCDSQLPVTTAIDSLENNGQPGEAAINVQKCIAQHPPFIGNSTCPDCSQTVCSKCGCCHYCEDIDLPCASIQCRRPVATLFSRNVTAPCNDIKARSVDGASACFENATMHASHYSNEDPTATIQMTVRSLCIYDMEPQGDPTWEKDQEDEEGPEQQDRGNESGKIAKVSAVRYRGLIEQRGGAFVSPVLDEGGNNTGWLNSSQCPIWPQDDDGSGQRRALLPSFPYKPRSGGAAALLVVRQQQTRTQEATRC